VKVIWTPTALAHLESIHSFIAARSPLYAQRTVDRITGKGNYISQFPLAGRMMPESGFQQIREVLEGPYRIVYHVKSDQIDIIAIFHGAQRTPWTESFDN
jgi:plasmid stabilization system protein ParE